MPYLMSHLVEQSGLTSRTIRDYIRQGFVAPPSGHGLAATYTEEQLLKVVVIARLRAAKKGWEEVVEALETWPLKKMRAYVRRTDPPAPPPAPGAPPDAPPPALEGAPAPRGLPPRHPEADTTTELTAPRAGGDPLLVGRSFIMANVLPGLAIILDHDAPALVKRIAAEIVAKYGVMAGSDR
ncbi:MAG TPA: MerR family transcriptional regulator [Polyangiaceae bacterium]|jgi:DNA-binding transcriptional MerR regulator|nr:MerR family transcriptional regulator [Polyangiaceae bacterium]